MNVGSSMSKQWNITKKAFQIANQYGYAFEKVEPVRHFAYHAMLRGDLQQALDYAKKL